VSDFSRGLTPWKQTAAGVRSVFDVLTGVEDVTIVSCETEPIFAALDTTTDNGILLPGLQRVTIYVGCGNLDVPALVRCAKVRKEHSQPLGVVTIVFKGAAADDLIREVESLRGFVANVSHRVGVAPTLIWDGVDCRDW